MISVKGATEATLYYAVMRCRNGELGRALEISINKPDDKVALGGLLGFSCSSLDGLIERAAERLRKSANLKTLSHPVYKREEGYLCKREPVPEGFLLYFRKEYRKRRTKIIENID